MMGILPERKGLDMRLSTGNYRSAVKMSGK